MANPKPIGFDNFRSHYFVLKDGSGSKFPVKASFAAVVGAAYRLYRGPRIYSTSANSSVIITTEEEHGLKVGQTVRIKGMPSNLSALNAEWVILTVTSVYAFTVGFNSTSAGASSSAGGIVGVDIGSELPTADYAMVVAGATCMEAHPAAWELPLEG